MSNKMSAVRSKAATGASKRKTVIQGKKKVFMVKKKAAGAAQSSSTPPAAPEKKSGGGAPEEQNGGGGGCVQMTLAEDQAKKASAADVLFERFRKGEMINSQAKKIILNVFSRLSNLNPLKSWRRVSEEAADLTGVSSRTVLSLKGEKLKTLSEKESEGHAPVVEAQVTVTEDGTIVKTPGKRGPKRKRSVSPRSIKRRYTAVQKKRIERYDETVLTSIRLKMHQFSERSEKPTVTEVLAAVNADNDLPNLSKTTMKRLLEDMGLKHLLRGRLPPKGHKTLPDGSTPPKKTKGGAVGANRVAATAGGGVGGATGTGGGGGSGGATGGANATGGATGAAASHNSFADSHRKWQVPDTYSARPSYSNASHYSDYQLPHQWTGGQNFSLRNEAHQNSL